jgi:hypothetical protein
MGACFVTSQYLTCRSDIVIDGQVVYPAGTLLHVAERDGDNVRVSGRVGSDRRKHTLAASLCCELPARPEGVYWEYLFPYAPAQLARLFTAKGQSGTISVEGERADGLRAWVEANPTHKNTDAGMTLSDQGYTITMTYTGKALKRGVWLYFFDFTVKAAMEMVND